MKRIHVVGCSPRSGTTLVTQAMIACFEIDLFTPHEDRVYRWPDRKADVFLTKRPYDVMVVESALRLMPSLHVIYMLRDPRDLIVSKHGRDPDKYWAGLRFWRTYTPYGHRLRDHPRVLTLRYEEFTREPDATQERIARFMPFLKVKGPFSKFHEMAVPDERTRLALGKKRPIAPVSVGRWKQHLPRVAGQIQQHGSITPDLIEYGYEPDASWEKILEGVEPDLSPSHFPEHFTFVELAKRRVFRNVRSLWAEVGARLYSK